MNSSRLRSPVSSLPESSTRSRTAPARNCARPRTPIRPHRPSRPSSSSRHQSPKAPAPCGPSWRDLIQDLAQGPAPLPLFPNIAAIIRACHELPGQRLFQYREANTADSELHSVTSRDVNDYLHAIGGLAVNGKNFRTWMGTIACAEHLAALAKARDEAVPSDAALKQEIVGGIRHAAEVLQNRASTCRKCYVHPAILAAHREGRLGPAFASPPKPRRLGPGLRPLSTSKRAVLSLLV